MVSFLLEVLLRHHRLPGSLVEYSHATAVKPTMRARKHPAEDLQVELPAEPMAPEVPPLARAPPVADEMIQQSEAPLLERAPHRAPAQ